MALALRHHQYTVVKLALGQVWSLDPAEPEAVLWCMSGRCWVTQAGDYVDYDLRAGEAFRLRSRGRVVAQALAPTAICVHVARRGAPAA